MDSIFGDLDFVFVYLDDILISSENEEEHNRHLRELFKRLSKAGLAINATKSKFFTWSWNSWDMWSVPAASDRRQNIQRLSETILRPEVKRI